MVIILSKDFKIFDNKIIILFILDNSPKPLSIEQITKLCEEFDDITYFDICSYIDELKKSFYIEELTEDLTHVYKLTPLGFSTLQELLELIPGVNLYTLKKLVNKNMTEVKTEYTVDTNIFPIKDEEYKVSCYIKDGVDELINITIYAGTKEQAKKIAKNWSINSDKIYNTILNAMTVDDD